MSSACSVRVRGVVQGVGFRPFVFRLARENTLGGWVPNAGKAWTFISRGGRVCARSFVRDLETHASHRRPSSPRSRSGQRRRGPGSDFVIRESHGRRSRPSTRVAPDLPVCDELSGGAVRPAESPLSVPLHQLHELRSPLFGNARAAVRQAEHDDEGLAARCCRAPASTTIRTIAAFTRSRSRVRTAVRPTSSVR